MDQSQSEISASIFRSLRKVLRNTGLRQAYADIIAWRLRARLDPDFTQPSTRILAEQGAEQVVVFTERYVGNASRMIERTLRTAGRIRNEVDFQRVRSDKIAPQEIDETLSYLKSLVTNIWTLLPGYEDSDLAWLYIASAAFMSNRLVQRMWEESLNQGGPYYVGNDYRRFSRRSIRTLLGPWTLTLAGAFDEGYLTPRTRDAIASVGTLFSRGSRIIYETQFRRPIPRVRLERLDQPVFGDAVAEDPTSLMMVDWLNAKRFLRLENPFEIPPEPPTENLVPPERLHGSRVTKRVWFGTNRAPDPADIHSTRFGNSAAAANAMSYGYHDVSISEGLPFGHRLPRLRRLSLPGFPRRGSSSSSVDVAFVGPHRFADQRAFLDQIRSLMRTAHGRDKEILVHIHGFNTAFDRAIVGAAKNAYDLEFPGLTVCLSWPSNPNIFSSLGTSKYWQERRRVASSTLAIVSFIMTLLKESGARAVHVVAHSMGTFGLALAMEKLAYENQNDPTWPVLRQVILAAPDIDVDLFREAAPSFSSMSRRTTMYVCQKDKALYVSTWVNYRRRAGFTPPTTVTNGIDTIDVSAVDSTLLGHSYHIKTGAVIRDIIQLIRHNTDPDHRLQIKNARVVTNPRHWEMR